MNVDGLSKARLHLDEGFWHFQLFMVGQNFEFF
jgi:hypothetical protein